MNFDRQVERVMREWKARQKWQGKLYGSCKEELQEMAVAAVEAMNAPLQWAPGDTIPDAVSRVQDARGVRWWRERENTEHGWVAFVPEDNFLTRVGEVTEVPEPGTPPAER